VKILIILPRRESRPPSQRRCPAALRRGISTWSLQ
jgi:hypothetical protein